MRILMLSHGYPPTLSGVTLVVQKLSRALVQQGHTVWVVTASERGEPYSVEDRGVHLERLRSLSNPFWSEGPLPWVSRARLQDIIDRVKPDVIHTHENAILSWQLLHLKRDPALRKVSSCYFLPRYVTHYLRSISPIEALIQNTIWKYAIQNLNQFDRVIFSTATQQREFIEHGLAAPSLAISNGVDTGRYKPKGAPGDGRVKDIEARYALPLGPRILFVGRLMKDKKIDLLIRAMAHILQQQEAHLLVVGRGDERKSLEKLVRDLGLERHIHLLGYIPESDLPALYHCTDLFAIASICEVQSIPALQAVACGLPIVAVNAAALPELVQSGVNGYLVPPDSPVELGEALLKVIRDPLRSQEMGRASLSLVKDHAEEETFRAYARFYEGLAGG